MNKRVEIVAEVGNTHEGSLGLAKRFVATAATCGVDAVKFQTHIFDCESLPTAPNPPYFKDETRKQYFERTAFSVDDYRELKRYSEEEHGIEFFSSPFSLEAVDLLNDLGVKTFKIASGEVTNLPLLEKIGRLEKRVILSSGMSTWSELDEAVNTLKRNGCKQLIVLQCTSEYPCPPEESGLNVLHEIKARYAEVEIGYSDHTLGLAVPLGAVMSGATFIEKHFTLSKAMYGSDAKNSTEPKEFRRLVSEVRALEAAIGSKVDKDEKAKALAPMKNTFEKSIVSARSLPAGHNMRFEDLAFKKPGDGISAKFFKEYIGRSLVSAVDKNHLFQRSDFA